MAQGQRLTDWQIETIRLAYAETGNASHAARQAGVPIRSAQRYCKEHHDALTQLRQEKRADVVVTMSAVRIAVLEEMATPARIEKASLHELATTAGILTDKIELLTGGATARTETRHADNPRDVLTRRLDELAERRRPKVGDQQSDGAASG